MKIFSSESNIKTQPKREKLSNDNGVKPANDQSVLYRIVSNFLSKNKKPPVIKKTEDKAEKLSQMPVQMKQDESEGEVSVY